MDTLRVVGQEGSPTLSALKNWRILTKVRMSARHATLLLRALLVLTNTEVSR